MRRRQPNEHLDPIVPESIGKVENTITVTRSYELLTPIFGGSPDPTADDSISVIRATEVRGQLRFWWRACYGGNYATIQEMKTAEDKLWGKAHTKGEDSPAFHETIQINIIDPQCKAVPAFTYDTWKDNRWTENLHNKISSYGVTPYIVFPLQATSDELGNSVKKPISKILYTDASFKLKIQFPKHAKIQMDGALWAWETFGGIGGRTRRGFGAIQALEAGRSNNKYLPKDSTNITEWIKGKCEDFQISHNPAPGNTPCLAHLMAATVETRRWLFEDKPILGFVYGKTVSDAWGELIKRLKNFRQPAKNNPWPDTKAIKELFKQDIDTMPELEMPSQYHFPKAALGLPIVFHQPKTENNLTLQGPDEGRERFASPLILRPLRCLDKKHVGIALVLTNRQLPSQNLALLRGQDNIGGVGQISANVPGDNGPLMDHLNNETDVVLAFMKKNFRS